jgi:hypothetical protein
MECFDASFLPVDEAEISPLPSRSTWQLAFVFDRNRSQQRSRGNRIIKQI